MQINVNTVNLDWQFKKANRYLPVRLSTTTFITANGLFKETKKCAYVDMITNLVLSLILVHFLGIAGVLIATVISMFIAEYIMKSVILFKHVLKKNVYKFFS